MSKIDLSTPVNIPLGFIVEGFVEDREDSRWIGIWIGERMLIYREDDNGDVVELYSSDADYVFYSENNMEPKDRLLHKMREVMENPPLEPIKIDDFTYDETLKITQEQIDMLKKMPIQPAQLPGIQTTGTGTTITTNQPWTTDNGNFTIKYDNTTNWVTY